MSAAERDRGQILAVAILATVLLGVVAVHGYAAYSFMRGRATVRDGDVATVRVLEVDHSNSPRMAEAWWVTVTDETFERRLHVSERTAAIASVEHSVEVFTTSDPPLGGHVEVAGERRYDDGPTVLLVIDAIIGMFIAIAVIRQRRARRPSPRVSTKG